MHWIFQRKKLRCYAAQLNAMLYNAFRRIIGLLTVFGAIQGHAQQIRFDQLSITDGLSSNTVYAISEDSFGKLWFGTLDGLNQYDGYRIIAYRHDHSVNGSLPNNRITLIYEDHSRHLWLYDEFTSIIVKYDRAKNFFKAYYLGNLTPGPLEISRVYEDDDGRLRVHSAHGYLLYYSEEKDQFEIDGSSGTYSSDNYALLYPELIADFEKHLRSVYKISTTDLGVREILKDNVGRFWIATRYNGLFTATLQNNSYNFTSHLHAGDNSQLINSEEINDIYEDRSGVIWIGTRNSGLYRFSPYKYKFDLIRNIDTGKEQHALGTVRAIAEDHSKNLWIGTSDQGLIRVDPNRKNGKQYLPDNNDRNSLAHRSVRSLWIDASQQLWVGEYRAISVYQPQHDNFKNYFPVPQKHEDVRIYDFKSDHKHGVWLAGWDLIMHYDLQQGVFQYLSKDSITSGFNNENIRDLELSSEGKLWIAVGEKGLSFFKKEDNRFVNLHYSPTTSNGLPTDNIFDVFKDSKGRIWLATADGLSLFDTVKLTCQTLTMNDGLPANMIFGLMEDSRGNLWFSSTHGIGKFDPVNKSFRNFDVEDGLQSNEFTENAFYKADNGTMYFGGINGVNYFNPDNVVESNRPPVVSITTLKVFDQPTSALSSFTETDIMQRVVSHSPISLRPGQRSLSFEFVAMHYVNPKKNKYAYMLEGFEGKWTYHDSNVRFANYTNLEPGTYKFKVKASNSDGYWSEPIELTIVIAKPLYAMLWFKITAMSLILLLTVAVYRLRIAALKRQQSAKAIQLETELNFLKSQVNPHFLFNTLNNIYALCQVNSVNAAPMVGKVSEMMRYMLYDCKENRVLLDKEIDYLRNFIDLHQLKSSRKLNVILEVNNTAGARIAPLLLINFLENSFKHGNLGFNEKGFIHCRIEVSAGSLQFNLLNSYQRHQFENKSTAGIGLENVKHRLELVYPAKHSLTIQEHDNVFEVNLIIYDL